MGCFFKEKSKKSEYYEKLNKSLKENFDSNFDNNMEYAFTIKRFNSIKNDYDCIDNTSNLWLIYILESLDYNKNSLIKDWKEPLYAFLTQNNFYNQYYFQNKIFYQEFLLFPKFIKQKYKDKKSKFNFIDNEPIFSTLDIDELNSYDNYSSKKYGINNTSFSVSSDNDHFHMSYTMDTIDTSDNNNNQELISKYNSYKLKKYIKIIREHLENDEHPITLIIKTFIKEVGKQLNLISKFCEKNQHEETTCYEKGVELIKEIQNFIEIMQVSLKLFYCKTINYKNFVEEKDEIINLITYIFFNNKAFYKQIFDLFFNMNKKKINDVKSALDKCKNITPKELGINPKFCLDKVSEEFWNDYKKNKSNNKSIKTNDKSSTREATIILEKKKTLKKCVMESSSDIFSDNKNELNEIIDLQKCPTNTFINTKNKDIINTDEEYSYLDNVENFDKSYDIINRRINIQDKLTDDIKDISDSILERIPEEPKDNDILIILPPDTPYNLAINYLSRINSYKVPLEKLIMISYLSVLITKSIDKYWEAKKDDVPNNFLNIDADEIMSIYLYIAYKLNLPSIVVQLEFIKYFTTSITKQSMLGYYYSTLEGCIKYMLQS